MTPVLVREARIVGADATAGAPVDLLVREGRIAEIAPRREYSSSHASERGSGIGCPKWSVRRSSTR